MGVRKMEVTHKEFVVWAALVLMAFLMIALEVV